MAIIKSPSFGASTFASSVPWDDLPENVKDRFCSEVGIVRSEFEEVHGPDAPAQAEDDGDKYCPAEPSEGEARFQRLAKERAESESSGKSMLELAHDEIDRLRDIRVALVDEVDELKIKLHRVAAGKEDSRLLRGAKAAREHLRHESSRSTAVVNARARLDEVINDEPDPAKQFARCPDCECLYPVGKQAGCPSCYVEGKA